MAERAGNGRVVFAALDIDVEEILPGLPAQRTRLDFGEVEIAQGECAEAAEQRAGNIARGEYERGFPSFHAIARVQDAALSVEQEKSREVLTVVFDGAAEDARAVDGGGDSGGDGGCVAGALLHDHLDAAGGVVERHALDGGMIGEEAQALIESDRMRVDFFYFGERDTGRGDEVVDDAHIRFADDTEVELEQMIVILVYGAGERVFDGDNGGVYRSRFERAEYFFETLHGDDGGAIAEQLADGFLAEGAELALEADFYFFRHVRGVLPASVRRCRKADRSGRARGRRCDRRDRGRWRV